MKCDRDPKDAEALPAMPSTEPMVEPLRRAGKPTWPRWREQLTRALLACLVCFVAEKLTELMWTWQATASSFWVAPPLLLAWWLTQPARTWLAVLLGAIAGLWLALIGSHASSIAAALLLVAVIPLPTLGLARLLRRHRLDIWPPATLRWGGKLLFALGVLLPLLDVFWVYAWARWFSTGYRREDLLTLLLMHGAGYLLLLPVAMALARWPATTRARNLRRDLGIAVVLAVLPAWLWSPWGVLALPSALMTLMATPLLLWTLLRFGLAGSCLSLLLCAAGGLAYTSRGAGPFIGVPGIAALLSMQAWIYAVAGALWLVSIMVEQQRQAARRLCQAYRQLSDLTGRILVVQEEERTRIARDLHDDINQSLAALSIRLSYVKRNVDAEQREAVTALQQDLLKVSGDIRNMSHGLHPAMLRFTGLASALTAFCQSHAQRSTLRIHCEVDPPEGLDDASELSLFRIVQEAMNNVEKHARAHEVWVTLAQAADGCVLSIADDGVGLPARDTRALAGLGLISMGERARLLGGQLAVLPRADGGTHVEVRFPCPAARDDGR